MMPKFRTPLAFARRSTRVVSVGSLKIGGSEPIRIQSMLTSNTCDIPEVLEEITALAKVRCELIRITVPNQKSVESLPAIRQGMKARGIEIPIAADIHFNPKLAIDSCEFVEKVRINPGNYADRKRFEIREYSEQQYQEELDRVEGKLLPLIRNLKKYHCALRIGTNHGSLSDRVLNRYGDTPEGMVESALEFIRIFRKHDFNEIIISMKSSIPLVMLQAYRFLAIKMEEEAMDYPLHLGVTEAGNGWDGRIKSAIGIGSLLNDGIGDTIRVSLTEPAENEIPAAQSILFALENFRRESLSWKEAIHEAPVQFSRRVSQTVSLGPVRVGGEETFRFFGVSPFAVKELPAESFDQILTMPQSGEFFSADIQIYQKVPPSGENFLFPPILLMKDQDIGEPGFAESLADLQKMPARLLMIQGSHPLFPVRRLVQILDSCKLDWPIGIVVPESDDPEEWYGLAAETGALIADGLIDCLACPESNTEKPVFHFCQTLLQSTRARLFKADFISCPSCGRTFFDLNSTTEAIKSRTQHLKGVKIGIMGCIVNGPGEMADADFGYVGAGEGKINLYKKQDCVERNIPEIEAVDRLINLIKDHGEWVDP
ncbi:MAG: (E)-4-hydroxy-3-methylbut-2-enyl-diphosphate synthase [SAR324 cluster bacterium]|nr:(E)-4-hydroxy-3-methylbut-2-enyl-diphosphate synthase [SAR324 cluster bacterium]